MGLKCVCMHVSHDRTVVVYCSVACRTLHILLHNVRRKEKSVLQEGYHAYRAFNVVKSF
jgi:hypothetical protein